MRRDAFEIYNVTLEMYSMDCCIRNLLSFRIMDLTCGFWALNKAHITPKASERENEDEGGSEAESRKTAREN